MSVVMMDSFFGGKLELTVSFANFAEEEYVTWLLSHPQELENQLSGSKGTRGAPGVS